jgi:hypothetical protein
MVKTDLLAIASPGSRALKNPKSEKYCQLRATLQPRIQAYREAGWQATDDDDAYSNACRLERRPAVRERIEYLSRQDEELLAEKRRRIEGQLWAIHEADIGECFETYEAAKVGKDGKLETDGDDKMLTVKKQRPRLLSDLPPEVRQAIEHVQIDARGNVCRSFIPSCRRMLSCARCSISAVRRTARKPMFQGYPTPSSYSSYPIRRRNWASRST